MDWVNAMRALSKYNKGNFLRKIRDKLLFKSGSASGSGSLPVGLPSVGRSGGGGSTAASSAALSQLEKKVEDLGNETQRLEKMATHASLLLDAIMFPPSPDTDAYGQLAKLGADAWDEEKTKNDALTTILRSCVTELALDYCTRVSTHVTTEYLDDVMADTNATAEYPSFLEIEADLKRRVEEREPYCSIFDDCLKESFANETCRPATCPFKSAMACAYLQACYDETIQEEYAVALGIISEGETFDAQATLTSEQAASAKQETEEAPPKQRGAWGFGG
mmetsp:Transcript_27266/g.39940  ORF Transcript_27266/g.39940 Transcript_27266/m.39940 type:complete len:278 (-) Transcript_27266:828-1661(-)